MDFTIVTELSGTEVSEEQIYRMHNRYCWAKRYCANKDVLEVACGTGQGLGILLKESKSLSAGDYSEEILKIAKNQYKDRIQLEYFNAEDIPCYDNSKDVIVIFEAIYYLRNIDKFISEARRILRNNGKLLISTVNKDLYDFFPSEFSYKYYGIVELSEILIRNGFEVRFFGDTCLKNITIRQKFFRILKFVAKNLHLIPKTMEQKKFLKRLMYNRLTIMPKEITEDMFEFVEPKLLDDKKADKLHKGIYCEATIKK